MRLRSGVLCLLLFSGLALAKPEAPTRLQTIISKISELKKSIDLQQQERDALQKELQRIEMTIGTVSADLNEVTQKIQTQRLQLAMLNQQLTAERQQLAAQREVFSIQLRASYLLGRQEYLRVVLNQENPRLFSRINNYFGYFNRYRKESIDEVLTVLRSIKTTEKEIRDKTASLEQLVAAQKVERDRWQSQQMVRQQTLSELSKRISGDQGKLAELEKDKTALTDLIRHLERKIATSKTEKTVVREKSVLTTAAPFRGSLTPFGTQRGKLSWPTRGVISEHFSGNTTVRSHGVLIRAAEGQAVRAVAAGHVIFANWLRGFGFLLIVDHGYGYMTLYGHNRSLYKKVGDAVVPGDLIATVGDSGGHSKPGVYFAIRHQGIALNPEQWLS